MTHRPAHIVPLLAAAALVAAACGDGGDDDVASDGDDGGSEVVLVTHDSFNVSPEVLEAFTATSGTEVRLLQGGDAGSVVNQAVLTEGNPQGDVLFGIDTGFLTRGLDAGIFEPYESPALAEVPEELQTDPEHRVTPVDTGDVCLNYDRAFFDAPGAPPVPATLADLTDPVYEDLLVVEDPSTSSPGLAFLYATIDTFGEGEDGWETYWSELRNNGVTVAASWEDAYYGEFSGGSGSEGDKPLVVSYASSPPAEVLFAEPPVDEAPTGVIEASCIRQIEYAGVLAGAANPEGARALVDFLLSEEFQADVPLQMFVFPVREGVALPPVFEEHAAQPAELIELDPFAIGETREANVERWIELVLR